MAISKLFLGSKWTLTRHILTILNDIGSFLTTTLSMTVHKKLNKVTIKKIDFIHEVW